MKSADNLRMLPDSENNLNELIIKNRFLDVQLKQDEDYSDFICHHCQQIVEIATEFRRVCTEAQTQLLINVQMKQEEPEDMDTPERNGNLSIEEERLEGVDISDNENYSEEVEVQPLLSKAKSSTIRKKMKKQSKTIKYQCHECGLTFKTQDLLKMHMHELHDMKLHTRCV